MKLSQLSSREIVDINTGTRLGSLTRADLELDETSGKIVGIWVETGKRSLFAWQPANAICIPWSAVQVIGDELLLVNLQLADSADSKA